MNRPKLFFYIQHLLGIGHLVRGARIAVAAAARFDVTVVLGGERPAGIDFGAADVVTLPAIKAGPSGFSDLVQDDGRPVDDAFKAGRREALLALFAARRPDILLIEAFPFGRRALRFELLPLLDAAMRRRPRPLVACSIRDILQDSRRPERDAETVALVQRAFDLVLVHGDPRLARLEDSFGGAAAIADRVAYTGLVAPAERRVEAGERFPVVVSVGGGAVGRALISAAVAARPLTELRDAPWLVLCGPNLPEIDRPAAGPGLVVRPFAADLPARLRAAILSISQAGYNTVADLLTAPDCRPVLVPYVGDGETEQTRRAGLLERAGLAVSLDPAALSPPRLAAAIAQALAMSPRKVDLDLDGATRACETLALALDRHSARLA